MTDRFFVDVASNICTKSGEMAAGDTFVSTRDKESGEIISVLSDGLGSGIKANVLSTLTTQIALKMSLAQHKIDQCAKLIYRSLPSCSSRKISYATFSIIKVGKKDFTSLIEYENPPALVFRGDTILHLDQEVQKFDRPQSYPTHISKREFQPQRGDRIILFSDGVTQAGMGNKATPFGWQNPIPFIQDIIRKNPTISARKLSEMMVNKARYYDTYKAKDDISCAVVYFRKPRRVLLVSGPPFESQRDPLLAQKLKDFKGKKVISGGTTAQIISREWQVPVTVDLHMGNHKLPPCSHMEGINLVTEGILTLARTVEYLEEPNKQNKDSGDPAMKLIELLLESDEIFLLGGTRINNAHQDPSMPVELEIRRNILKKLKDVLKNKYTKSVQIEYL
ncbi:SpoIIE family protein phosphatase [Spirochaeta cellobiosiphila]|uniref:SpoIIE family protein phosphatase n=1 Tax=Spirochaeta cellobiosiphila TaxID=504483 RepID=UPI000417D0A7|nr:SpoIIE family protein phosphatase [Spirochaeta cellobiosiphila]